MNVENVKKLIDHMESIDDSEYDQRRYTHECGSPSCIAGHAVRLARGKDYKIEDCDISYIAGDWLDIPVYHTIEMFKPYSIRRFDETTKQEAINMLKNFLETGEVVWGKSYMNIENINKLIDHLKSISEIEYDQRWYTHGCGSPSCMGAGHAVRLARGKDYKIEDCDISLRAGDWLGIHNIFIKNKMFCAMPMEFNRSEMMLQLRKMQ